MVSMVSGCGQLLPEQPGAGEATRQDSGMLYPHLVSLWEYGLPGGPLEPLVKVTPGSTLCIRLPGEVPLWCSQSLDVGGGAGVCVTAECVSCLEDGVCSCPFGAQYLDGALGQGSTRLCAGSVLWQRDLVMVAVGLLWKAAFSAVAAGALYAVHSCNAGPGV